MDYKILQTQYDKIYSYFKTTCEPFDFFEWDGKTLQVWNDDAITEVYCLKDLNLLLKSN